MKIILRENIETLGTMGEELTVKDGYARNFLIPKELAYPATKKFLSVIKGEVKQKQVVYEKEKQKAEVLAKEMENVAVTITVTVGEEDKMFGSVTTANIAEKLHEAGYDIDRKRIVLNEPIKALGVYHVSVKLHQEVKLDIKVWVVKEQTEELEEEANEVDQATAE
jgi:large subunit ribosomal protein L9